MPRMRTITQAVQYLKEQDPGSSISEWWLRQLVKTGKLKCHRAGAKYMLDLDALERFLENPPAEPIKQPLGIIRQVIQ